MSVVGYKPTRLMTKSRYNRVMVKDVNYTSYTRTHKYIYIYIYAYAYAYALVDVVCRTVYCMYYAKQLTVSKENENER